MNDLIFEIVKCVVMVAAVVLMRYIVPWLKLKIDTGKYEAAAREIKTLVYAVQERYGNKTGAERRAIVLDQIKTFLASKNITLTDEQIRALNDAAYKGMKIAENQGVTIEASGKIEEA